MDNIPCYHCGDNCNHSHIQFEEKNFCCTGCKTVYEIFHKHDLEYYYDLQAAAGKTPIHFEGKYDFLESDNIVERLLEFDNEEISITNLYIPHIHCSSCIWILENLNKLHPDVVTSVVDFPKKTVRVTFRNQSFSLKELVVLLARIGYEPHISLENFEKKEPTVDRSLIYKLGVAGFAFGNIMFLSFPEYFEVSEYWLEQYKGLFRWLIFAFSLPVVFYAAKDYFISAYKGIRSKLLNIDVPIALGIIVLFLRSTLDIFFDWGSGFFDSLTGLVFFLLLGKFFQQRTYSFLSFERDYKSYFPMAVTRIIGQGATENVQIYKVKKGDHLLIRHGEIIPADGSLVSGKAQIDYSFVTGESVAVFKKTGDKIYAGGKQLHNLIEMKVLKPVSQSYLTQLWSNSVFQKNTSSPIQSLTDKIAKEFTLIILTIAVIAASYWMLTDYSKVWNVFTAVLIIACPCAIALSAPFTLGNLLRIFGRKKFYLKDSGIIEDLASIDTAIFDKTGTITSTKRTGISYEGMLLSSEEEALLANTLRASNHPLSRALYTLLADQNIFTLDEFEERIGEGLEGIKDNSKVKIGSAEFVGSPSKNPPKKTTVHISANDLYKGCFVFHNSYRSGVAKVLNNFSRDMQLAILSGDNNSEKKYLETILPPLTPLYFNQKPEDKLEFIKDLQIKERNVMMVGDGLNDAGALAQSNVGVAVSENINVFSPACDAILDATKISELYSYVQASKHAMQIIKVSFILSLLYNIIGLYFAVTGQLEPVVAAILMPLSSISIVIFTTLATNIVGRKIN